MARKLFEVRDSPIHGKGVFAIRPIPRGTTIVEYTGERISWDEADRREEEKDDGDTHTMLFTVSKKVVIDATRRGSDARYVNHSCWGNCRTFIDKDRVYIESRRNIQPEEELFYDYKLSMDGAKITKKLRKAYACRCGSSKCRGTLLFEPKQRAKKPTASAVAERPKAARAAKK